jgi:indolepyruvate ferredoxin oxidoreductase
MLRAFGLMAKLKFLRGGAFDIFGRTAERRMERQLIADYRSTITGLLATLDVDRIALAVRIAIIPEQIRGYGHIKDKHLHDAKAREAQLLAQWRNRKTIPIVQAA